MNIYYIIISCFSIILIGAVIKTSIEAKKCKDKNPEKSYGRCFAELFLSIFGIKLIHAKLGKPEKYL